MKSIYLANNHGQIDYVYSEETKKELSEIAELDPKQVFKKDDLLATPEKFADAGKVRQAPLGPRGQDDAVGRVVRGACREVKAAVPEECERGDLGGEEGDPLPPRGSEVGNLCPNLELSLYTGGDTSGE